MKTKQEFDVAVAEASLKVAKRELDEFEALAENNVFLSLETAEWELQHTLEICAFNDCEGAHHCGSSEYTRDFIVDGVLYVGTLDVEYNQHDKTYYFIEESKFSYSIKTNDI